MITGQTIALTRWTFVGKVMFLFFNMLCRFVIGEGNGTPLQYSCLENPMDGGAWWAAVHGVAKSQTKLSDFTFTFHFCALEKEMATHSSVLAWRIPGMGAWWAAVYGVAQSQTRLKQLSSSSSRFITAFLPKSKRLLIPYVNTKLFIYLSPTLALSPLVTISLFSRSLNFFLFYK